MYRKTLFPICILLICIVSLNVQAQFKYDTIVNMGIYRSYFDLTRKQPVAVTYTLYKGGGPASRKNDHFYGTSITLCDKSYSHCGFDRGHMVPAEDFAYSDSLQAITFSYYNVVPQTMQLNRGAWKSLENKVRKLSQFDTVVVVCMNEYKDFWTPAICYKFVFCRKKLVLSQGYTNTQDPQPVQINSKILPLIISMLYDF